MSVNIVNKSTGALTKIAGNPVEQASGISYDHTSSGMQANNVQAAVDELRSGLTNVNTALSVPDGTGKNLIPMTVGSIKALNTSGTWSGNTYTKNSVSYELQTDTSQNIIGIVVNGTATGGEANLSLYMGTNTFNNMILSGCPQVQDYNSYYLSAQLQESPWTTEKDNGWGKEITIQNGKSIYVYICVKAGITANNLVFYPMIRPAGTTPDFVPYIPSVESRIEAVESGLMNKQNISLFTSGWAQDLTVPQRMCTLIMSAKTNTDALIWSYNSYNQHLVNLTGGSDTITVTKNDDDTITISNTQGVVSALVFGL